MDRLLPPTGAHVADCVEDRVFDVVGGCFFFFLAYDVCKSSFALSVACFHQNPPSIKNDRQRVFTKHISCNGEIGSF